METKKVYETVILGAGPAGISAAIYLKRADIDIALIEKGQSGGKISNTAIVENYPGFVGISGIDLAKHFSDHARANGVEINYGDVISFKKENDLFEILTDIDVYHAKTVVVATGTRERLLNVPGEDKLIGKGVSFCAICDGTLFKNLPVVMVGGGNAALEEGLYMANLASKVYIIHRRNEFRAEPEIIKKAQAHPKIEFILNTQVEELIGDKHLTKILIRNLGTNAYQELEVRGVFPYIGSIPNTDFLKELHILDKNGYILANNEMATAVPGLFAAGDIICKSVRQIVTAVNDGAIAALSVGKLLKGK